MNQSLSVFLTLNKFNLTEGFICPHQKKQIKNLIQENEIKNILEIGFNAGHSADFMLSQKNDIFVTSVDIGKHQYTVPCADFLLKKYPDRLKLMIGDSRYTLQEINEKFDFILIDGGHSEDICYADIINCKNLANSNTIILLDDYSEIYGQGVIKAFNKAVKEGFVEQINITSKVGPRGWLYYKYV